MRPNSQREQAARALDELAGTRPRTICAFPGCEVEVDRLGYACPDCWRAYSSDQERYDRDIEVMARLEVVARLALYAGDYQSVLDAVLRLETEVGK